MAAVPVPHFTIEEYLAMDRAAERRSEYYDGQVFPVDNASFPHARLVTRLGRSLENRLAGGPCSAATMPRVRSERTKYLYPDLAVVCGAPVFLDAQNDILENPRVIVEVLSPSTQGNDSGPKFRSYRRLDSLREYVLAAQDEPAIEVFRLEQGLWVLHPYTGLESTLRLESIGVEIPLAEIYQGVL